jgi:cobyrinic acid a,c-diamide synthase
VLALSRGWLPIYAECGGFMFLCRELVSGLERHAMAGVFDTTTRLCARPQGLGYTEGRVVAANPFYPSGSVLMGHEFHYSCCETGGAGREGTYALAMERGKGMSGGADGLLVRNTWGSYFHMHPLGGSGWAGNFVRAAAAYQAGRRGPVTAGPPAGEGTGSGAPLEEAPDQGCAW